MRYVTLLLSVCAAGCASTNSQHIHPFAYSAGYETGAAILNLVEEAADGDSLAASYIEVGLDGYMTGLSDRLGVRVSPCEEE